MTHNSYSEEQIKQASEWFDNQEEMEEVRDEFFVLRAIVMGGADPIQWFNELLDMAFENIETEQDV